MRNIIDLSLFAGMILSCIYIGEVLDQAPDYSITINKGEIVTYNIKVAETDQYDAYSKDSIPLILLGQILEENHSGYTGFYVDIHTKGKAKNLDELGYQIDSISRELGYSVQVNFRSTNQESNFSLQMVVLPHKQVLRKY